MCRGIDIDDLRIVINYDMPEDEETYIHRVGRSGRYGGQGVAINFCTNDDNYKISIFTREYDLDIQDMPDPEEVNLLLTGMTPPVGKSFKCEKLFILSILQIIREKYYF